ncbi:NADH-quinone oxidoreductase subunit NuoE [Candidatus Bathyarchaeota archaeon]|nr:MAG: NADH-quinone oxidoreductase subunit NuoE [Candidatus Bathyarchaeota archaeon]
MKGKRFFVGVRLTEEQRSILSRIQKNAGLSKTDILLKGLELLSEYYSLGLDHPPLSLELKRLEEEAVRHAEALKRIRRREDALKEIIRELRRVDSIVDKYDGDPNALIQILLDIQKEFRWVSKPAMMWVSERLGVPLSRIYQIATFYKVFSLTPQGRHKIRVCLGTACHVRGGPIIMERVKRLLGIEDGEVTPDGRFSLERVNCLGCCALGPVMVVDNEYYGNVKPAEVEKILSKYE